jgi:hypothetical protein
VFVGLGCRTVNGRFVTLLFTLGVSIPALYNQVYRQELGVPVALPYAVYPITSVYYELASAGAKLGRRTRKTGHLHAIETTTSGTLVELCQVSRVLLQHIIGDRQTQGR